MKKEIFTHYGKMSFHRPTPKSPGERTKTTAQTKEGTILGLIQKFRNDAKNGITYTPQELEVVFKEYYNNFKTKPKRISEIKILNWQSTDSYRIYKGVYNDFRIVEFQRDKLTGEIKESEEILVKKEYINYLLEILQQCALETHYDAKFFWSQIIKHYNLEKEGVDIYNFNGGGPMRSNFYFPYYLYPMKVIEKMGLIRMSGGRGGGIWRVK